MPHAQWGTRPAAKEGEPHPFATPFDQIEADGYGEEVPDFLEAPYSLQDIDMQALSYAIRSKPDWQAKYKNPEIRSKWRAEALASREATRAEGGEQENDDEDEAQPARPALTENMVDWVLDELAQHDHDSQDPNGIRISAFDKVYESDSLIPDELRQALLVEVAKLEDVPEAEQDWHPGSNRQVLDLVHPSLHPLIYGRSPLKTRNEDGTLSETVSTAPEARHAKHSTSKKFQWLPTDFTLSEEGQVKIESYINGLHPERQKSIYPVIAQLFERFVPLFERVLSDLQAPPPRRIPITSEDAYGWYKTHFNEEGSDDEDEWYETRPITLPEPKAPFALDDSTEPKELAFKIRGKTVQVIVKLANILLTPEQPEYKGGVWHVEGMQNEEIVSSGIYYYDEDNISESRLAFRGTFDDELLSYEQSDDRGVGMVYGVTNEGPCVQTFNSLRTQQDRCIAFPNIYQHRVSPFSLLNPTKPGHRKIVVFFLVDPLKRIPSTTEVAPQQLEWVADELWKEREKDSKLPRLPDELWAATLEQSTLISLKEAKELREELMKERKFLVQENSTVVFERPFSLCEH